MISELGKRLRQTLGERDGERTIQRTIQPEFLKAIDRAITAAEDAKATIPYGVDGTAAEIVELLRAATQMLAKVQEAAQDLGAVPAGESRRRPRSESFEQEVFEIDRLLQSARAAYKANVGDAKKEPLYLGLVQALSQASEYAGKLDVG